MNEIITEEILSLNSRVNVEKFEDSKILVTGASGMLGSYFANSLNSLLQLNGKLPAKMLLTSRNGNFSNIRNRSNKNFSYFSGHFNQLLLEDGFDFVFHAASPASPTQYADPEAILEANLIPLKRIAETQTALREIFFISAGETYGTGLSEQNGEEDSDFQNIPESRKHYPIAKLAGEELLRNIAEEKDCASRIIKLFHCFGPGVRENDGRSFADFIWAVARGGAPIMKSAGDDLRSFLYLEDVMAGILVDSENEINLEFNLGSGNLISILDFARKVMQIGNVHGEPVRGFDTSYIQSPHKKISPNCDWLYSQGWTEMVSLDDAILRTLKSIQTSADF